MRSKQGAERWAAWWALSLAAALPAPVLAAMAGAFGPARPVGVACAALALAWLALHLSLLQPALDRRAAPQRTMGRLLRAFLRRALAMRTVADVAVEAQAAADKLLGVDRVLLLVAGPGGRVSVLGGDGDEGGKLDEAERALRSLRESAEPFDRTRLSEVSSVGIRAISDLLDKLDGDAVAPLVHRGLLVGCLVLGRPRHPIERREKQVRLATLAAHTTMALVGALLDGDAPKGLRASRRLATALAAGLLPRRDTGEVGRFVYAGTCRQIPDCGGDFWAAEALGDERLLIVLGDAAGHGPAAAMLAAMARGAALAACQAGGAGTRPEAVLRAMHRAVSQALPSGQPSGARMTAVACLLDARTEQATLAGAAHVPGCLLLRDEAEDTAPPSVLSLDDGWAEEPTDEAPLAALVTEESLARVEPIDLGGPALGSPGDLTFPTRTYALPRGTSLVLVSDGLVEAGAPGAVPFGPRRFVSLIQALATRRAVELPGAILDEVDRYLVGRPVADDMTVIAVEIRDAGAA